MNGRGMFQYTAGSMPHRRPITVVVGAPIKVHMNEILCVAKLFCKRFSRQNVRVLRFVSVDAGLISFQNNSATQGITVSSHCQDHQFGVNG